ncbi:FecR family protein [Arenibacter nanhaiticus]|uniref:FecR family protein n=1 Tax=Arenibacter nanhaiticus TaxID=558155 RepID=A0A1M6EYZ3_9FLAO|nr:FecR domain-containing protein [Arenibacter nanhaiticus]SHI90635.1 FecR family protein [Arenibacter nanhaiticus]
MQENYLAKWLNNELSEEEVIKFKATKEYATYQKIVETTKGLSAPKFDMDKAWNDLKKAKTVAVPEEGSKVISLNPLKKYLRIAAVVALMVSVALFYNNSLDERISTQYAERAEVVLPDASEVVLNAESKIRYSKEKWAEKRSLSLSGEAYFKVAKGKRFSVNTPDGTVAVLGTQFNVESRKGYFEVSCYEGLVSVTYRDKEIKLPAGNSFLVIDGEITPTQHPSTTEPAWLSNESTFKSIPLRFVFEEFQRQYNVKVSTKNIDESQLFSGSFSNQDIELALQSISVPSQIKFKFEGNKVLFYAKAP